MIDFKNKATPELFAEIAKFGYGVYQLDGVMVCSDPKAVADVQAMIDKWQQPLPDLNHRQFVYFLAYNGLDDLLNLHLNTLKRIDRDKYADLKAQFFAAYDCYAYNTIFNKLTRLKADLLLLAPTFNLEATAIKAAWNRAKLV